MAKAEKKISIIIPLYNVEEHVSKAAESISSQALDGLEIIVVDDGSSDSSLEECIKGLQNLDVKAIRQENTGPGGARNAGILAARGEYIVFLDSDDFLLPNALENILNILEAEQPDILFGRYLRWLPSTGLIKCREYRFSPPRDQAKRTEYILGSLPEPSWNVWRYVCRRDFIMRHNIFFEKSMLCEDVKWVMALLAAAENPSAKISHAAEPFYAYNYRRTNSIMNRYTVKRLVDLNLIIAELINSYTDRPSICRILIWQSFFYINEYCTFNRKDRSRIFESYCAVFPLYKYSSSRLHRLVGKLQYPALFYGLSASMYMMKRAGRMWKGMGSWAQKFIASH